MKILIISRCLPYPLFHGDHLILHYLARELALRGHELELLAFSLDPETKLAREMSNDFDDIQVIREFSRSPLDYLLRLPRIFPEAENQCWNPEMWSAIRTRIERFRYDLVHFFGGIQVYEYRNTVAPYLPTVIVPYDSMSLYYKRRMRVARKPSAWLLAWGQYLLAAHYERQIYHGFGRTVTVSEVDAALLRGLNPALPIDVIPNGVDCKIELEEKQSNLSEQIIFVGNYAYPPNLEAAYLLIKTILPRIHVHAPDLRVLIVGPNPPAKLRSLASPTVEVTGYVDDVSVLLRQSDCFVSPLHSGAGIRNKILEAMAAGVPVVATPLSCEGIDVDPGENVLLANSPEEFARTTLQLLKDTQLQRHVRLEGHRLVSNQYSWGRVADRYERLYGKIIAEFKSLE